VVAEALAEALESLNLKFPMVSEAARAELKTARKALVAEAPRPRPAVLKPAKPKKNSKKSKPKKRRR